MWVAVKEELVASVVKRRKEVWFVCAVHGVGCT